MAPSWKRCVLSQRGERVLLQPQNLLLAIAGPDRSSWYIVLRGNLLARLALLPVPEAQQTGTGASDPCSGRFA